MRESPSLRIIELLRDRGARVDYNDPYFPRLPRTRKHDLGMSSVESRLRRWRLTTPPSSSLIIPAMITLRSSVIRALWLTLGMQPKGLRSNERRSFGVRSPGSSPADPFRRVRSCVIRKEKGGEQSMWQKFLHFRTARWKGGTGVPATQSILVMAVLLAGAVLPCTLFAAPAEVPAVSANLGPCSADFVRCG